MVYSASRGQLDSFIIEKQRNRLRKSKLRKSYVVIRQYTLLRHLDYMHKKYTQWFGIHSNIPFIFHTCHFIILFAYCYEYRASTESDHFINSRGTRLGYF